MTLTSPGPSDLRRIGIRTGVVLSRLAPTRLMRSERLARMKGWEGPRLDMTRK